MSLECNEAEKIPLQDLLCDLEKSVLSQIIEKNHGIKARAADQLMLNRTTLVEKAKKYGFPMVKK